VEKVKESFENLEAIKSGKYACPDCGSVNVICEDNCKDKFVTKIVGVIEVWIFNTKQNNCE
jgi:hypothetical protein